MGLWSCSKGRCTTAWPSRTTDQLPCPSVPIKQHAATRTAIVFHRARITRTGDHVSLGHRRCKRPFHGSSLTIPDLVEAGLGECRLARRRSLILGRGSQDGAAYLGRGIGLL
jgi:hypothetical protein